MAKKKCDNDIYTIFWKSHDISITIYRYTIFSWLSLVPWQHVNMILIWNLIWLPVVVDAALWKIGPKVRERTKIGRWLHFVVHGLCSRQQSQIASICWKLNLPGRDREQLVTIQTSSIGEIACHLQKIKDLQLLILWHPPCQGLMRRHSHRRCNR